MAVSSHSRPPRRLTDREVARLVAAGRRLGYPLGTLVEVMALTGAPPRATRFMRWADIAPDQTAWTPRPQRDEAAPPTTVPLVPDVAKLLEAVPARDKAYVFAGPTGRACADNARKRVVIARAAGLEDFEFADLWHTLQSELSHPDRRETLEGWAGLIHSLLSPPDQPKGHDAPPRPADLPTPASEDDSGTHGSSQR